MKSIRPLLVTLILAAGCGTDTTVGPGVPVPPDEPKPAAEFSPLRLAPSGPLDSTVYRFVARRGTSAEVKIRYQDTHKTFLEFKLEDKSLLTRPDGSPFANGDTVTITIRVPDGGEALVEFEPSGLRFDPENPAELKLEYGEADGLTPDIERKLAIWRQETVGGPWEQLGSVRFEDSKEIEADLTGFSRYAISY